MTVSSRIRSVLLGAGVVLLATMGISSPAFAHDALEGSDPATGASVEVAPAQVTLTFTAELMPDGAEAQVFASADPVAASQAGEKDWAAGPAVVDGMNLIIPLQEGMPIGTYSVNWRVVSSDGHAISTSSADVISFTVTRGAPAVDPVETPSATPSASASAAPTAAPTAAPSAAPDATPSPDSTANAEELPGLSPVVIWTLVIGGVILLGVLAIIVRVARKS